MACLTQVAGTVVYTRTVLGTGEGNATSARVALRHLVDKAQHYISIRIKTVQRRMQWLEWYVIKSIRNEVLLMQLKLCEPLKGPFRNPGQKKTRRLQ